MKKLAFIIIMPDINKENEKTWGTCLDNMQLMYDDPNSIKNGRQSISTESRWALGYISWKKLISQNTDKNIDFYFVRTHYKVEEKYTIDDNIINVCFSKFNHGHIFYKTITALRILKDDYNYFVRGNLNTIIDFNCLSIFLNKCPLTNFFASPLWEGNSYPWGHFILFSNDIAKYLSSIYYLKYYNRIFKEATADDYELTQIVLKKFKYTHLPGCDKAFQPSNMHIVSKLNKHALRVYDTETIDEIINQIKHLNDTVFLFRIKHLKDDSINNFIFLYKFLTDFILNMRKY